MEKLSEIEKRAFKGDSNAQKKLGDIYSGSEAGYGNVNDESYAAHWYKAAFINKNKEALAALRSLADKGSEAASSSLINIFLNGDLNKEGRNLEEALSEMQKISMKNTGQELSRAFTDTFMLIASDVPNMDKAFETAHSITDTDKKNYALIFRPSEAKFRIPIPLNVYLQYTVEVEKEMLKREGRNADIIAPEVEGGWGYSEKEAVIVKAGDIPEKDQEHFIIKCEKPICAKILFRHALDLGLSNIHFEEENQILMRGKGNKKYDVLEYHVSGIPLPLLHNLRNHFEKAQNEKDEKATEKNIYLHQAMMLIYHIRYWFQLPARIKS